MTRKPYWSHKIALTNRFSIIPFSFLFISGQSVLDLLATNSEIEFSADDHIASLLIQLLHLYRYHHGLLWKTVLYRLYGMIHVQLSDNVELPPSTKILYRSDTLDCFALHTVEHWRACFALVYLSLWFSHSANTQILSFSRICFLSVLLSLVLCPV